MANLALVTGASGGIGEELARIHAEKGGDLVLVARSADRLQALKDELVASYSVSVTVIDMDLAATGAAQALFENLEANGLAIDTLINNAGFGGHGPFHEQDLSAHQQMMQLNMVTLAELTHLCLPGMIERGSGRILNVSSTAGFMPGPLQAVYYATKAFVNSLSQAIAEELRGTGVTVTALCPGAVNTNFQSAGNLEGVDMWKLAVDARSVAECGYRAMEKGQLLVVNQLSLGIATRWFVPLIPRKALLRISRLSMTKRG